MILTPKSELQDRITKLMNLMAKEGIESSLIVHRPDLFYLTGTAQRGYLFLSLERPPLLLIRSFIGRAKEESSLDNIVELPSTKRLPEIIKEYLGRGPTKLGLELDVMPYKDFCFFRDLFEGVEILDVSPLILEIRKVKSTWEIARMKEVAHLSRMTFEYIIKNIRPNISEVGFAGEFEAFARRHGHAGKLRVRDWLTEGYTFHILSGHATGMVGVLDSPMSGIGTSPAFPCGASLKELRPFEPIMIDLNLMLNGYHFDETRMFALKGMPEGAMRLSMAAIDIQEEVLSIAKVGIPISELYQKAWEVAKRLKVEEEFLGLPGYKTRYIGHGIGVELVEPPILSENSNELLLEGMVFALEPKLVSQKGFGAGVESIFLVRENGAEVLSETPSQVFVIDI